MAYGPPARRVALLVRDASRDSPAARLDLAATLADLGLVEEACAATGAAAEGFTRVGDRDGFDRASLLLVRLYLEMGHADLAAARLGQVVAARSAGRKGVDIATPVVSPEDMATTISLYEAGARLAEVVDEIAVTGEPVTVIHDGRPVVVLMPPD